ncbi:Lsr2 dimerization domain-containing protein [Kineococcus sp. NBC_00420]|uniref:histone-like nucleoid-structuring protein Lsr2 n=1 Tax=Kineococcus sp. NBC_00420 TaxID=2903564 RepID=UPI003FA5FC11
MDFLSADAQLQCLDICHHAPMATRTTTQLIDDVDGTSPATGRIVFTLEGAGYEIDLSTDHARQLRAGLDVFIQHARRTGKQTVGHRDNYKRTTLTPDHRIIRAWALDNGHTVTTGGPISPPSCAPTKTPTDPGAGQRQPPPASAGGCDGPGGWRCGAGRPGRADDGGDRPGM